MVNNIPVNGWPQLKDLEAVQPTLDRLDKIEAWKRTVKEETFTGDDITIENALALPARSLITSINAIQDLHGYDKPWAGGAGKNKWPFGDFNGTYSNVPFSLAAGTYTASKTNPAVNCGLRFFYADDTSIAFTFFTSETFTLTADVVKINYSSADATTENFMIESGTTATSFAPYSNICPISGRDSVAVDDTGKNLIENVLASTTGAGVTFTVNADKIVSLSGTSSSAIAKDINSYTGAQLKAMGNGQNLVLNGGNAKAYIAIRTSAWAFPARSYGEDVTLDVSQLDNSTTYYVTIGVQNNVNVDGVTVKPMLRHIGTSADYVPYAHSSATIQLGQTVYGAEIDWDTGVMTVLDAIADMGDLTWTYNGTSQVFNSSALPGATTENVYTDAISSSYKEHQTGMSAMVNGDFRVLDGVMTVKDTAYTDATAFKTAVTGQTVCYKLAESITLQLTPTMLEMLKGYNRVTLSDGYGTIELKALTGANWS